MAATGKEIGFNAQTNFNEVEAVYWICFKNAEGKNVVCYVGQTDNLKRRMAEHLADRQDAIWAYKPSVVYAEIVKGQTARLAREASEIAYYQPACNKLASG